MERETNDQLAKNGLVAELQLQDVTGERGRTGESRRDRTKAAGSFAHESIEPQLASKQAAVDQAKQLAN